VIRIETIRPVGEGLSADLSTYNKYNKQLLTVENVSLNYRNKNLDIFADFLFVDTKNPKNRDMVYSIPQPGGLTEIKTSSIERDGARSYTPQTGFNYIINKNHTVGARYQYNKLPEQFGKYEKEVEVLEDGVLADQLHSKQQYSSSNESHYVNAYYNGTVSRWLTVKVDADYKTTDNKIGSTVYNTLTDGTREDIITANTSSSDLYAGRLVLTTPLWNGKLTYGGQFSHTKNRQDSHVIENMGAPGVVPSSNDVTQDLFAGFISYNRSFGNFSGDVGVRFENTSSEYIQNGERVDEQSKTYRNLFPTARISYQHNKFQTELAYRNTISRPPYDYLRSGIFYTAPYSYFSGNPLLQPTYKNSLTFTAMWQKFLFMLVYDSYKDLFVEGLPQLYLDNSILLKSVNFEKSQRLSATFNYSTTLGVWRPNVEMGVVKDFIEYGGESYNDPVYSFSMKNSFRIKGWQLGLDITARTKGHRSSDYLEKASWNTTVYASKYFLKNKLGVQVTGSDIFNTVDDKWSVNANNLKIYSDTSMYRRSVHLRVSYRFNATPKRYRGSASTDELDRF